jgi:hypothetical protein
MITLAKNFRMASVSRCAIEAILEIQLSYYDKQSLSNDNIPGEILFLDWR